MIQTTASYAPASLAERAIREGQLAMFASNLLSRPSQPAVQETVQAGFAWHGFNDIQTLVGLEGLFLWTEDAFRPARIAFRFAPGMAGFQGSYRITSLLGAIEDGTFHCVPNNPAIGYAFISLVPVLLPTSRTFIVAGMQTDSAWKINMLLLNKVGSTGPLLPPLSAIRIL